VLGDDARAKREDMHPALLGRRRGALSRHRAAAAPTRQSDREIRFSDRGCRAGSGREHCHARYRGRAILRRSVGAKSGLAMIRRHLAGLSFDEIVQKLGLKGKSHLRARAGTPQE
jgi:hypothetical protein